jgi:hypothetical protein
MKPQKAYIDARGCLDPNWEEAENRKRPSVSFSILQVDNPTEVKDTQIRTFINRFDLRIEIKPTQS